MLLYFILSYFNLLFYFTKNSHRFQNTPSMSLRHRIGIPDVPKHEIKFMNINILEYTSFLISYNFFFVLITTL